MKNIKEIEVKVEPHTSQCNYYCIYYRTKRKINIFNFWNLLVEVWNGAYLSYNHPVLIRCFDDAVKYAKQLKENPELINKHYKEQDELYDKLKKEREDKYNERNKTLIL